MFALGLGLSEPWKLSGQRLDIETRPHELYLEVVADRGAVRAGSVCLNRTLGSISGSSAGFRVRLVASGSESGVAGQSYEGGRAV